MYEVTNVGMVYVLKYVSRFTERQAPVPTKIDGERARGKARKRSASPLAAKGEKRAAMVVGDGES